MLNPQNLLIYLNSAALIPLLTFPLSFLQSWHCIFMCSALQANKNKLNQNLFLQGRLISYSLSGAAYGYFGQRLSESLEYQALGALAYMFFALLTLALILYWFFSHQIKVRIKSCHNFNLNNSRPSFLHGLLMAFIPCPILFQFFGLATLTGSLVGGFLVGLAHGLASTPALWWGAKFLSKILKYRHIKSSIQIVFALLLIFNLYYFSIKLLSPISEETKLFFCL